MGTWGTGVLDNDTAADFLSILSVSDSVEPIEDALRAVIEIGDDYLEAYAAEEALAAADVVSRLIGRQGTSEPYDAGLNTWIAANRELPWETLDGLAQQSVSRILSDRSELLELWQQIDQFSEWEQNVKALKSRFT